MYILVCADDTQVLTFEMESLAQAMDEALRILAEAQTSYINSFAKVNDPTDAEIAEYNYRIENADVFVTDADGSIVWSPSDDDLKDIGWIQWERLGE